MPRHGLTRSFLALLALLVLAVGAIPGLPSMTATAATTLNQSRAGSAACNPADADWELQGHNTARITYNGQGTCVGGFAAYNTNGFGSLNEPGAYQSLFGSAQSATLSPASRTATLTVPEYDDETCFAQLDVVLASSDTPLSDLFPDPLNAGNQGVQYNHLVQPAITRGSRLCSNDEPPPPPPTCETSDASWTLQGHNTAVINYSGEAVCLVGFAAYDTNGFGSLNEPGASQDLFGAPASAIVSPTNALVTLTAAGYTDASCKAQLDVVLAPLGTSLALLFPNPLNAANQGPQSEHLVQPAVTRGSRDCGKEPEPVAYTQYIVMVMKPAAPPPPPPCSAGEVVIHNSKGEWRRPLVSSSVQGFPDTPFNGATTFQVVNYTGSTPRFIQYAPFYQNQETAAFTFPGGSQYAGKTLQLHVYSACGHVELLSNIDP